MKLKKEFIIIAILTLLAVAFRLSLIANHKIYFWYDQARDAHVAQEIIKNRDLKIQGPSASGTNDTIYHGVAYYYLIAPLYTLFNGNPYQVAIVFAVLNSAAVAIIYLATKDFLADAKIAFVSAILLALNFSHAEYSTWLSNPTLALLPILFYFWALWQIFYSNKKVKNDLTWWLVAGISLGLIEQSAFYAVYFWGTLIIAIVFANQIKKQKISQVLPVNKAVLLVCSYLLTISSMILTQVKLFLAGIFTPTTLAQAFASDSSLANTETVIRLLNLYIGKGIETLLPTLTIAGLLLLVAILLIAKNNFATAQKWFLASWILAPLWLFVLHFRDSPHMLVGIEYPILILLASCLVWLYQQKRWHTFALAILISCAYIFAQTSTLIHYRNQDKSIFTFQTGVSLEKELRVIDYIYDQANNQPFSISLWVSPHEYYITWAYLFNWYGINKYGYAPSYFGSNQAGKYGENLLKQQDDIESKHFIIEEPSIVILGNFYENFINKQNAVSSPTSSDYDKNFVVIGGYKVQAREKLIK